MEHVASPLLGVRESFLEEAETSRVREKCPSVRQDEDCHPLWPSYTLYLFFPRFMRPIPVSFSSISTSTHFPASSFPKDPPTLRLCQDPLSQIHLKGFRPGGGGGSRR